MSKKFRRWVRENNFVKMKIKKKTFCKLKILLKKKKYVGLKLIIILIIYFPCFFSSFIILKMKFHFWREKKFKLEKKRRQLMWLLVNCTELLLTSWLLAKIMRQRLIMNHMKEKTIKYSRKMCLYHRMKSSHKCQIEVSEARRNACLM